eukprot:2546170-Amphidinium_carterae.1
MSQVALNMLARRLHPSELPAITSALCVSLMHDSMSVLPSGRTFRRKIRLIPSGASPVRIVESTMTTFGIIKSVVRTMYKEGSNEITRFGILADNANVFSKGTLSWNFEFSNQLKK